MSRHDRGGKKTHNPPTSSNSFGWVGLEKTLGTVSEFRKSHQGGRCLLNVLKYGRGKEKPMTTSIV